MRPLLCLSFLGCAHRAPMAFAPSLWPITSDYREDGPVDVKLCQPVLFGIIPLAPAYGMQDLVQKAEGDHEGVIRVSIDQTSSWWLIGTTTCHELHGVSIHLVTAQTSPPPLHETYGMPAAKPDDVIPELSQVDISVPKERRPSPLPSPVDAGPPSASAYRFTDMIYEQIGRPKPSDEALYLADVKCVWDYVLRGLSASELISAAQRGIGKLGPDATLAAILAVGLALPP